MKKNHKKSFSIEKDLNFESLSQLLNDTGIVSHPLTNEQKVCIEYPNISSESNNMIINDNNANIETENTKENKIQNDFTLILSEKKNFTIDVKKLYKKYPKNFVYSEEVFTNSIKIFVSIFNNFNNDIFKWDLEKNDLFNTSNKVQFFLTKDVLNNNINIINDIEKLYKEHLDLNEINNNEENKDDNKEKINDDFDDFEENKNIENEDIKKDDFDDLEENKNIENVDIKKDDEDDFEENIEITNKKENNEEEIILKNIYFLMNIFNLMNYFYLNEYTIDSLMRNISLFNSYIINDHKILLLIYFNLCIQINITLSKKTIDNFLGISSPNSNNKSLTSISSVSSAINTISKSINIGINFISGENDKINKNIKNGINNYIPSLYFIDFFLLEKKDKEKEKENNDKEKEEKENIILFNFIIKSFFWTYFIRNKICLKIFIKILNIEKFEETAKNINIYQKIENKDKIYELVKTVNYINLLNDNLSKEYFILMNVDFNLIYNINLEILYDFFNLYFPIFINCNMISFEITNKKEFCNLSGYLEELNIIIWLFKFYLKIKKYKFNKHTFTFLSDTFSLAFKKNKNSLEESYTKEITLFMSINNYKSIDLINYFSDINNFNGVYKLYKLIIKSCNEYKNYDIGIRLFKDDIINPELNYYIAILILKLQNYIHAHHDIYKKLVLYENKIINPSDCVYLNIKKKLLKLKNKDNEIKLKEKGNDNVLSKLSKINIIPNILKKNVNDSNADKNEENLNNFYRSLTILGLNHEEKTTLYNFIKQDKYYFTEFLVYLTSNIILNKTTNQSFDPLNILSHFSNNKCIIILTDNLFIDIYAYLTDSFDINIAASKGEEEKEKENDNSKRYLFFNAIMANMKLFKFQCKENFDNKVGHMLVRNTNIILNKSTLLQKELFYDYKSLLNEDNNIFILDEYTKTHCIFGKKSISLISENNYENYFEAFYNMFLNCYGIIKFINEKKMRKFIKLNLVYKNKILQIKEGNIQLKKIKNEKNNEENEENYIIDNKENKDNKCINHNILKINELFNYTNSYPLIEFILMKESEISNFSFLFYAFEEIFLSKKEEETQINKAILSKRILKFFNRFKTSNFTPVIIESKYFFKFLNFFEKIINKKDSSSTHFFQNVILILENDDNEYNEILDKINKEAIIFKSFVKKIHIFKLGNINKHNKNVIGRMFKFNRIMNTMKELYNNSEKQEEENIVIYNIDDKILDGIIKKMSKNISKENNDNKEKEDEKNATNECLIF